MDAERLPLPMAHADPAFVVCVRETIATPELMQQFDRLYGATLVSRKSTIERMIDVVTGKQHDDIRTFYEFVHNSIYMRLPDEAIHSLRATLYAEGTAP
jgi:hypothetical protein